MARRKEFRRLTWNTESLQGRPTSQSQVRTKGERARRTKGRTISSNDELERRLVICGWSPMVDLLSVDHRIGLRGDHGRERDSCRRNGAERLPVLRLSRTNGGSDMTKEPDWRLGFEQPVSLQRRVDATNALRRSGVNRWIRYSVRLVHDVGNTPLEPAMPSSSCSDLCVPTEQWD
jgi:hypothetical protein